MYVAICTCSETTYIRTYTFTYLVNFFTSECTGNIYNDSPSIVSKLNTTYIQIINYYIGVARLVCNEPSMPSYFQAHLGKATQS